MSDYTSIEKQATKGHEDISERQDLSVGEMNHLRELFLNSPSEGQGLYKVIVTAFYAGYYRGLKKKGQ